MKNFDLIMVSTHQDDLNIFKLINSIGSNIKNIKVLLIVISQECKINSISQNPLLDIIFIDEVKMGLSKARNVALKYLLDSNISAEYIMFPDDDSSFDKNFFINFPSILNSNKCYTTPIYNTGTKDLYFGKKTEENKLIAPADYKLVGSPNQIILYNSLKKDIVFNEDLGVGAKYGSSEDLDLFLNLYLKGNLFVFTNKLYNFHPKKVAAYENVTIFAIINRFRGYSSGFAFVIFKYKLFRFIPEYLIRTLAAFIIFAIKLNFKLSLAYLVQFFLRIKILIHFFFYQSSFKK